MVLEIRSREWRARGKNMNDMVVLMFKWAYLARAAPSIMAEMISAVMD